MADLPREAAPRDPSSTDQVSIPRAAPRVAHPAKPRPDPRPLRIAYGMGAVASISAFMTALALPGTGATIATVQTVVEQPVATAPVRHVIEYVQLKPGQTAPPKAVVKQAPTPTPRVVIVTTRQSGGKP